VQSKIMMQPKQDGSLIALGCGESASLCYVADGKSPNYGAG